MKQSIQQDSYLGTVAVIALLGFVLLSPTEPVKRSSRSPSGSPSISQSASNNTQNTQKVKVPVGTTDVKALVNDYRIRAALNTIAWAEGTYYSHSSGYGMLFGGGEFNFNKPHPNIHFPFRGTTTTAAGRYQFLNKTWYVLQGDKPMTRFNQDAAAVMLLQQCKVVDKILSGDTSWINDPRVGGIWASFPNNTYRQRPKSYSQLVKVYKRFLGL